MDDIQKHQEASAQEPQGENLLTTCRGKRTPERYVERRLTRESCPARACGERVSG
jgi:hypothetical protein